MNYLTWATSSSGTAEAGMTVLLPIQPVPDLPLIAARTILPRTRIPPADEEFEPADVADVALFTADGPPALVVLGVPHLL